MTAIANYPAGAGIVFNDKNVNPPAEFYFYCLPVPEWGYWSLCDTPSGPEEIPGTSQSSVRCVLGMFSFLLFKWRGTFAAGANL